MRGVSPIAFTLILLATVLAGCLGDDDPDGGTTDDGSMVTDDLGAVSGRVLTVDLDEVEGANVQLVLDSQLVAETRTGSDGHYTLSEVEPGDYRLQVTAPCCRESVQGIQVTAGEVVNVDVQMVLFSSADLRQPHVDEFVWEGFLGCGVGTPAITLSACEDVDPNDEPMHLWEIKEGLEAISIGMTWDPAGGLVGEQLILFVENRGCTSTCDKEYARVGGESPIVFTVESPDDEWSFENVEDVREMQFLVLPDFEPDFYYQQPFTVHYQLFYNQGVPADHNPIPDQ